MIKYLTILPDDVIRYKIMDYLNQLYEIDRRKEIKRNIVYNCRNIAIDRLMCNVENYETLIYNASKNGNIMDENNIRNSYNNFKTNYDYLIKTMPEWNVIQYEPTIISYKYM